MAQPLQLVDGSGSFNIDGVEDFAKSSNLVHAGLNYQIVAIMGPQSSGKSTLMNHVFGTSFTMMDALSGRRQTTKGIWMAKSPKMEELDTIILDLEGTDGRERGEDDTTFERQSALFALAVSDIVMINIWCHDIGREHGAGKPLMKTVFQVNLKLFTPSPNRRKTVLVFVIRDKSRTPMERLVEVIEQDWDSIWNSIAKPPQYEETSFKDFFEVVYTSLPNYEEKEDDFKAETYLLRKKFEAGGEGSFVRSGDKLPGDAVPLSAQKVWEVVKSQKDLDLPAHKIMVANTRCAEIMAEQYNGLKSDASWEGLVSEAEKGFVPDFGERASGLVDSCLTGYDEEAMYFDSEVRDLKRIELVEKVHTIVKPAFEQQVVHLQGKLFADFQRNVKVGMSVEGQSFSESTSKCREQAVNAFGDSFSQISVSGTPWAQSDYQPTFETMLTNEVEKLKSEKIEALMQEVEAAFSSSLSAPAMDLLDSVPIDLWTHLRSVLASACSSADAQLKDGLEGYDLSPQEWEAVSKRIRAAGLKKLESNIREAAHNALSRMKDRFGDVFNLDENKLPRTWTARDNIPSISKAARLAASDVLAQLAILQSEGVSPAAGLVERAIRTMAKNDLEEGISGQAEGGNSSEESFSVIGLVGWPNVDDDKVLLTSQEVRSVWRRFMSDTKMQITQAALTQQANKLASSRAPPLWAIFAMLMLGLNEFMAVVTSPLLALVILVFLLFMRTLYIEMDVDGEMQKGALPGMLSLGAKFVPSVKNVSQKTITSAQTFFASRGVQNDHAGAGNNQSPAAPSTSAPKPAASFKESVASNEDGLRRRPVGASGGIEMSNLSAEIQPEDSKDK
ncbi:hypothetical protein BSKO_02031 [Bryopsis sp. KO-2023]|nr:hypothetical protein BSKO_02031 [Bryopsis sp. KO-2023]